MKGIVTAGGAGSRLYPVTLSVSKQLLPVYDKPMVYYPIATLLEAGVRDILIISTPHDLPLYEKLLGDGGAFGVSFTYAPQARPQGIAQAFHIGQTFIAGEAVALVLGDNVFYGHHFPDQLRRAAQGEDCATVFGYRVRDPERYGVIEFDDSGNAVSIEEKPEKPRSNYAVVGLYFYDRNVVDIALGLEPSARGEYEITDVNRVYLQRGSLRVELMEGIDWLDTGTHESLLEASNFIRAIEERRGIKVACLEEIAFRQGWIGADDVLQRASALGKTDYAAYLQQIVRDDKHNA